MSESWNNYPKISVIYWESKDARPEEGSYILLECVDESGTISCEYCAYEGGDFIYFYNDGTWGKVNENIILGWSYLPFDEH